jgi:hypothetical protein
MKHWRRLKRLLTVMERPLRFEVRAPMAFVKTTGAWEPCGWFRKAIERPAAEHVPYRVKPDQSSWFRTRKSARWRTP